ncbi:hypothetical protein BCR43DRAFT_494173 [Syncephalastrum racemosum]|uniref:rRNA-processing protein FYV7 n=1 Tax=Syncephalastrum racemosum TaxID=13706 RepID=A0A1X2H7K1_SYNRA|nr:hypothetical protein BCR43DRAFT_494173 [Syncephalastrum racemosum]
MPPKTFKKRGGKPMTSHERSIKKRKDERIHKSSVKSQYYKEIAKENPADDTPDYVKEIFERTIDENGNVVAYGDRNNNSVTRPMATSEKEYDLDAASSSDDEEGKAGQKRRPKPNRYKDELEDQQRKKRTIEEERAERQRQREEKEKARKKYYRERNNERRKMLVRNERGQPNMNTQVSVLLEKMHKKKLV